MYVQVCYEWNNGFEVSHVKNPLFLFSSHLFYALNCRQVTNRSQLAMLHSATHHRLMTQSVRLLFLDSFAESRIRMREPRSARTACNYIPPPLTCVLLSFPTFCHCDARASRSTRLVFLTLLLYCTVAAPKPLVTHHSTPPACLMPPITFIDFSLSSPPTHLAVRPLQFTCPG